MSGIAATVGGDPRAGARWVAEAAAFMARRGPDRQAAWHDGARAGLAHALLAVAPEDARVAQPLTFGDDVWLVADARLDARDEIARALRGTGRDATAETPDAELVLHAYHAWGEACLERLRGDFAFALWDGRAGRLLCAHDQFGVVPLYYARLDDRLLVSNTLDALLLDAGVPDALDERTVADLLMFGANLDASSTTFAAIRRLAPGESLSWRDGALVVRRYHEIPEPGELLRLDRPEAYVERFRGLFETAVADRLRGGGASVQLSGGLDSTSVAVVARRVLEARGEGGALRAFTVVAERGPGDEEGSYAAMVAAVAGIPAEQLVLGEFADLDPLAPPVLRPAEPQPYVRTGLEAEFAARTVRAGRSAFSGLGGDALLMFLPSWWMTDLAAGRVGRVADVWREHQRLFGGRPAAYLRPGLRHRRSLAAPVTVPDLSWLEPAFVERVGAGARALEQRERSRHQIDIGSMTGSPLWANLFTTMDPGFAGIPVRYRHPFFDLRLVEFCRSLPPVPWFPRKWLLREAMRGLLPEPVRTRPKTPLGHDPRARLARERGAVAGADLIIAETCALSQYVRRERLCLGDGEGMALQGPLGVTLSFAHWMHHWRRPSVAAPSPVAGGVR